MRIALNLNLLNETHENKIIKNSIHLWHIVWRHSAVTVLSSVVSSSDDKFRCKYARCSSILIRFAFRGIDNDDWFSNDIFSPFTIIKDLFRFLILRSFSSSDHRIHIFIERDVTILCGEHDIIHKYTKHVKLIFFGDSLSFLNSFFHFSTSDSNEFLSLGRNVPTPGTAHSRTTYTKQQNLCLLSKHSYKTNFTRSKLKPKKWNQRKNTNSTKNIDKLKRERKNTTATRHTFDDTDSNAQYLNCSKRRRRRCYTYATLSHTQTHTCTNLL